MKLSSSCSKAVRRASRFPPCLPKQHRTRTRTKSNGSGTCSHVTLASKSTKHASQPLRRTSAKPCLSHVRRGLAQHRGYMALNPAMFSDLVGPNKHPGPCPCSGACRLGLAIRSTVNILATNSLQYLCNGWPGISAASYFRVLEFSQTASIPLSQESVETVHSRRNSTLTVTYSLPSRHHTLTDYLQMC
jgi:hypothetical protein